MKSTALLFAGLIVSGFLLVACQPAQNTNEKMTMEEPTAALTDTYWKLVSLDGKAVVMGENQEREQHFVIRAEQNQITGFAGCNGFFGAYETTPKNAKQGSATFSNLGATKMACPDLALNEQDFLNVFANTVNYEIAGETLILSDKSSNELATFTSVYLQ